MLFNLNRARFSLSKAIGSNKSIYLLPSYTYAHTSSIGPTKTKKENGKMSVKKQAE